MLPKHYKDPERLSRLRLYYSQNSPYARVARITALESSLADRIQHIQVVNRSPDNPLLSLSPAGRVPTLIDGDLVISESRHICAYLDHLQNSNQFVPSGMPNWHLLSAEGTVVAFLDSIVSQVSERRRPPNPYSQKPIVYEEEKSKRCHELFGRMAESKSNGFVPWDFTGISLAAALALMEFHSFEPNWRSEYPGLADWYSAKSCRPAMRRSAPL